MNKRIASGRERGTDMQAGSLRGYALHGLCVWSEIPFAQPACECKPDLHIRWGGSRDIPADLPRGEILARLDPPLGDYTLSRTASGYLVRFPGLCDFEVQRSRRLLDVHLATDADPDVAPILLGGNVVALLLGLSGKAALHASAVRVEGRTIAVVGGAGMGKSTLAAMFCSAGAECVSDDLLRVEVDSGNAYCFSGASQIRLRAAAAELAGRLDASHTQLTYDGRIAMSVRQPTPSKLALDAVLLPRPSKRAKRLSVERLRPRDAVEQLIRYPRITGWQIVEPIQRHFQAASDLATRVPTYSATIPWGPPFSHDIPSLLLEGMGVVGLRAATPITSR